VERLKDDSDGNPAITDKKSTDVWNNVTQSMRLNGNP